MVVDNGSALRFLHCVHMGSDANVSEVHVAHPSSGYSA